MAFAVSAVVAVGAIAAAETVTVAMVLTAVADIGMCMTVVGAATGSKDLMKIGGALSLVGGVGGMVNGALSSVGTAAATDAAASTATENAIDAGALGGANTGASGAVSESAATTAAGAGAQTAAPLVDSSATPTLSAVAQPAANPIALNDPGAMNNGASWDSLTSPTPGAAAPGASGNLGANSAYGPTSSTLSTGDTLTNTLTPQTGANVDEIVNKAVATGGNTGSETDALWQTFKTNLGSAWDSLGSQGKAELLKSALAVPGGIQNQQNKAKELALMQQRVNQTSYGSQPVPTFGIINKLRSA